MLRARALQAALKEIREVGAAAAIAAAVAAGYAEKGSELRARLPSLRKALKAALVNRDAFSATGGAQATLVNRLPVSVRRSDDAQSLQAEWCAAPACVVSCAGVGSLVACFAEDNQQVLGALMESTAGCERAALALANNPGASAAAHLAHSPSKATPADLTTDHHSTMIAGTPVLLVRCVRDRRIAVITLALDLIAVALPHSPALAAAASAAPVPEILLRMLGTAPPALAERAVAVLRGLMQKRRLTEARARR